MPLAPSINELRGLQVRRRFCIVSQSRCDRSCEAFVARALGFRADMAEKDRKALWDRVSAFRKGVERGGGEGHTVYENQEGLVLSACVPIVLKSALARSAWDDLRRDTEKDMRRIARTLPVWSWVEGVRGFGDLGLAIIVGETGDLSNYATKERLWKRLGLAVIGDRRQQKVSGSDALAHGYNPVRRAEVWTIGDSMFRQQWAGEKDGIPSHPKGPYGMVYAARKAYTTTLNQAGGYAERAHALAEQARKAGKTPHKENLEGRLTPKHLDNDARRIMTKALVENLWRVWNGKEAIGPNAIGMPHAPLAD